MTSIGGHMHLKMIGLSKSASGCHWINPTNRSHRHLEKSPCTICDITKLFLGFILIKIVFL